MNPRTRAVGLMPQHIGRSPAGWRKLRPGGTTAVGLRHLRRSVARIS